MSRRDSYEAKYLGGHSAFPKKIKTILKLNHSYLEIPDLSLKIPYVSIAKAMCHSDLKPGPPTGFFGAFLGSTSEYYIRIDYKDERGNEQYLNFDVGAKNFDLNVEICGTLLCRKFEFLAGAGHYAEVQDKGYAAGKYEMAAEMASRDGVDAVASTLYERAGNAYLSVGNYEKAVEVYEKAGDISLKFKDFDVAWYMYFPSSLRALSIKKFGKARRLANKAIEAYKEDYKRRHSFGKTMEKINYSLSVIAILLIEGLVSEAKGYWNQLKFQTGYDQKKGGALFDLVVSAFQASTEESFRNKQKDNGEPSTETVENLNPDLKQLGIFEFNSYLNSIGYEAEVVLSPDFIHKERSLTKGLIKLNGTDINYIVKDTNLDEVVLEFVVEGIENKIPGIDLKVKEKNKQIVNYHWESKNEELAATLNKDQDLMKKLSTIMDNGNFINGYHIKNYNISIEGDLIYTPKKNTIVFFHRLRRLPPKEYFEAMDKVAHHIRGVLSH